MLLSIELATLVLVPMHACPYLHLPNACMHGRLIPIPMNIISSQRTPIFVVLSSK